MLVFVLNQAQKANTGKIQTPVYENVREFGLQGSALTAPLLYKISPGIDRGFCWFQFSNKSECRPVRSKRNNSFVTL